MNSSRLRKFFITFIILLTISSNQAFCELTKIDMHYAIIKNALELTKEQDEQAQLIFCQLNRNLEQVYSEYKFANAQLYILERENCSKKAIWQQKCKIKKLEKKIDSCIDKYNDEFNDILNRSQRLKFKRLNKNLEVY